MRGHPHTLFVKLILLAALACPGPAAAGGGELVVWTHPTPTSREAFARLVDAWHARQGAAAPRVRVVPQPFDGLADKVAATVPRGRGPDVFFYPQDRLGGFVEAGVVAPLEPWVTPEQRARYIPVTLQAVTYRGVLQGLPINFNLVTLVYDPQKVSAPPRTTAELAALARRLTDRRAGTWGFAYDYANPYFHAALQNALGGGVLDAAGRPSLDAPENVRAAELLLRWRADFLPERPLGEADLLRAWDAGEVAMAIQGPWFLTRVRRGAAVAPLPALSEAGDRPLRPWLTVEGLYVTRTCAAPQAAADFIRWVTDAPQARLLAWADRESPAAQAAWDPELVNDPVLGMYMRQVRVAVPMPNAAEMTAIWGPLTTALGRIATGAAPPAEELGRAQAAVLRALAAHHP